MRKTFIHKSEQLLVWSEHDEHVSVNEEIEKISDVMGYADEHVVKFFRIDDDWNFEDVTEDVAQAWLDEHGEHPDEMNTSGYGAWLEASGALEDYIENYEEERSDFDEHNTLNHAQQGIPRR